MMNFISKQKNTRGEKGEDKSSDSRYMMGPLDRDNQEYQKVINRQGSKKII